MTDIRSVIVADPNTIMLQALSELFERDRRFTLVATSKTAEGFLESCLRVPVDIDEDTLKKISDKTAGKYYRADSTETLKQIYEDIDKLERTEIEAKKFQFYDELFAYFVVPGAILFALELLLSHTVWRKLP